MFISPNEREVPRGVFFSQEREVQKLPPAMEQKRMRIPIGSCSVEVPETWKDRTVHTFVAPKVVDPRMTPHLRMGSGFRENISISRERVKRGSTPETYIHKQMDGAGVDHCTTYDFQFTDEMTETATSTGAIKVQIDILTYISYRRIKYQLLSISSKRKCFIALIAKNTIFSK